MIEVSGRIVTKGSFSLQDDHNAHKAEHHRLQPGMFAQHDCYITHAGHVASHTANDISFAI